MPYHYAIDAGRRLALVLAEGRCDFACTMAAMHRVAADPAFGPGFRVLVDVRSADATPSTEEARAIAAFQAAPDGFRGHRIALVVAKAVDFGMANMLSALAGFRGGLVRGFLTAEEALGWLDAGGAHPPGA